MEKVKIGVLGAYRGESMIKYARNAENCEIVAICDKLPELLEEQRKKAEDLNLNVAFYENFDEFINHDMDAVVLANYADEHAPFAIKAMKKGLHVFSEVLPVQTMKEAVELIETVEETGKIYAYGENYCYFPSTFEMKKIYQSGKIGEFEYAEGEYIHNCESIWPSIAYGDENHWRNQKFSTFYCTHSLGPIIHATGLRPVSVIGIESTRNERALRMGSKSATLGIEMVTLENGGIVKSIHGGLYKDSIWYTIYGSKGRVESGRENGKSGQTKTVYLDYDEFSGDYERPRREAYDPDAGMNYKAKGYGHDGSDYYSMWNFVEKIKGNPDADIIDVYEAIDMGITGMFAFRSILDNSKPTEIPNLRLKSERDKWRNDVACTNPEIAKDMLLPTQKGGTPVIEKGVYDRQKKLLAEQKNKK